MQYCWWLKPAQKDRLSHYLQGFVHPCWCRSSEPSTVWKEMWYAFSLYTMMDLHIYINMRLTYGYPNPTSGLVQEGLKGKCWVNLPQKNGQTVTPFWGAPANYIYPKTKTNTNRDSPHCLTAVFRPNLYFTENFSAETTSEQLLISHTWGVGVSCEGFGSKSENAELPNISWSIR